MKKEKEERMELGHEAEPGFKAAFYAVFTAAAVYLAYILIMTR